MRKYILNPETLLYEIKDVSLKSKLIKGLLLVAGSVGLSVLYLWVFTSVLGMDLPKTALLKAEMARWDARIDLMNSRLDRYESNLDALRIRDDDIYRSIFGMNEIPASIRTAGIGGVDRYAFLDGLEPTNTLKNTALRIDKLTRMTYVQSKSFDEVATLSKRAGDMASCIPAIPPFSPVKGKYNLSSPFGYRNDPMTGETKYHDGQDFAMDPGTPVYATGDGVVEYVKFSFTGYGNEILIDHGFGYKTRYAHMSIISVAEGMRIKRGDCIGESGNSGKSTGPHLHYEVLYRDERVNPMNYLDMDMSVQEYSEMVRKRGDETKELLQQSFRTRRR